MLTGEAHGPPQSCRKQGQLGVGRGSTYDGQQTCCWQDRLLAWSDTAHTRDKCKVLSIGSDSQLLGYYMEETWLPKKHTKKLSATLGSFNKAQCPGQGTSQRPQDHRTVIFSKGKKLMTVYGGNAKRSWGESLLRAPDWRRACGHHRMLTGCREVLRLRWAQKQKRQTKGHNSKNWNDSVWEKEGWTLCELLPYLNTLKVLGEHQGSVTFLCLENATGGDRL